MQIRWIAGTRRTLFRNLLINRYDADGAALIRWMAQSTEIWRKSALFLFGRARPCESLWADECLLFSPRHFAKVLRKHDMN